jgi:hypothetical protein
MPKTEFDWPSGKIYVARVKTSGSRNAKKPGNVDGSADRRIVDRRFMTFIADPMYAYVNQSGIKNKI